MYFLLFVCCAIGSYLLGSLNTAIGIVQQNFGVDIRNYGSGNAGATNVYRTFGPNYGMLVFVLDALKGFLVVHLVYLFPNMADVDYMNERIAMQLCFGALIMIGHIFPLFYQFRGGKGVATILGIIVGINLSIAFALIAIFLSVVVSTRYVSLGSIIAAIAYPVLVLVFMGSHPVYFLIFSIQATLMVLYSHRKNILKLFNGEENKFLISRRR